MNALKISILTFLFVVNNDDLKNRRNIKENENYDALY